MAENFLTTDFSIQEEPQEVADDTFLTADFSVKEEPTPLPPPPPDDGNFLTADFSVSGDSDKIVEDFRASQGLSATDPTKLSPLSRPPSRETDTPQVSEGTGTQPVSAEGALSKEQRIAQLPEPVLKPLPRLRDVPTKAITENIYLGQQALSLTTQVVDFIPALFRGGGKNIKKFVLEPILGKKRTEGFLDFLPIENLDNVFDASGRVRADARQWLMESAREKGGKVGKFTAETVDAVEQTLMNLRMFEVLGVGYGVGAKGTAVGKVATALTPAKYAAHVAKTQKIVNVLKGALVRSGIMTATTEQDSLKGAASNMALSLAYQSTPAISGWFGRPASRIVSDIALNFGISSTQAKSAIEAADKAAIAEGNPQDKGLYRAIAMSQMLGSDVIFGVLGGIRGMRGDSAKVAVEKAQKVAEEAVPKAEGKAPESVALDALKEAVKPREAGEPVVSKPIEVAGEPTVSKLTEEFVAAKEASVKGEEPKVTSVEKVAEPSVKEPIPLKPEPTKGTILKDTPEPELQKLAKGLNVSTDGGRNATENRVVEALDKMTVEQFDARKKTVRFAFEQKIRDTIEVTQKRLIELQNRDVKAGIKVGVAQANAKRDAKAERIKGMGEIAKDYIKVLAPNASATQKKVWVNNARSEASLRGVMDRIDKVFARNKDKERGLDKSVKVRAEEATGVRKITDEVITNTMKQLTDQFRIQKKAAGLGALAGRKQVREQVKIKRETNKTIRDIKKFEKLSGQKSKALPQEFKDQIKDVMLWFSTGGKPNTAKQADIDKATVSQSDFIRRLRDDGRVIPIPDDKILDVGKLNLRDMTLSDLQALRDQVKMIAHIGRNEGKMIAGKRRVSAELVARKAEKEIAKFGRVSETKPAKFGPMSESKKTLIQNTKKAIDTPFSVLRKPEFIADFLGPDVYKPTIQKMQDAANASMEQKEVQKTRIKNLLAPFADNWKDFTEKPIKVKGTNFSITREQAVTIVLNDGNKGNEQRLIEGNKLSKVEIKRVIESLSAKERAFVNKARRIVDAEWEASADVAEKLTGIRPQKIKGKYWPIMVDKDLAVQSKERAAEQDLMMNVANRSFVSGGHVKSRVGGTDAVSLRGVSVLVKHLNDVTHFNTHAIPVRDVNKLIRSPRFRKAITETYNESIYNQFPKWLKSVANPRVETEGFDRMVNTIRANSITANLGLKVSVSAMQAGSLPLSVKELGGTFEGSKWVAKGIKEFYRIGQNPRKVVEYVNSLSTQMRNRASSVDRDMNDATSRDGVSKIIKDSPRFRDVLFSTIRLIDASVTYPTWLGAFAKEMSASGNQSKAVEFADKVVRKTQPAGAVKDLAQISKGGAFQKLFTQYYTFFSNVYNQLASTKDFVKLSKKGVAPKMAEVSEAFLWVVAIPAIYADWARNGFKRRDPEEMIEAVGSYLAGTVPIARDIFSPYGIQAVPAMTGPKRIRQAKAAFKKEGVKSKRGLETAIRGTGQLIGAPTEQGWITATGAIDLMTGETKDFRRLGFSKYSLEPPKSKKKSKNR